MRDRNRLPQTTVARALTLAGLMLLNAAAAAAPVSTEFFLTGLAQPGVYDLARLESLPPVTQTVSFTSGSGPQTHTYTGADLWNLLADASVPTNPLVKGDLLRRYVIAVGSDGYQAVFSMGELSPDFGHQPDLLALTFNDAPVGDKGFARLVVPDDVRRGRWVSNLISLEVFRAEYVPLPATWSLVALGLSGLAIRRRHAA